MTAVVSPRRAEVGQRFTTEEVYVTVPPDGSGHVGVYRATRSASSYTSQPVAVGPWSLFHDTGLSTHPAGRPESFRCLADAVEAVVPHHVACRR